MLIVLVLLYFVKLANSGGNSIPQLFSFSSLASEGSDLDAQPRILPHHWSQFKSESSHPIETLQTNLNEFGSLPSGISGKSSELSKKKKNILRYNKKCFWHVNSFNY